MDDYKIRMVKEYVELKERYEKLHKMIVKYDAGILDFTLNCPIDILRKQKSIMGEYLNILEIRSEIENIDLKYFDRFENVEEPKEKTYKVLQSFDSANILFDSFSDADCVLRELDGIIDAFGFATIDDFYNLSNKSSSSLNTRYNDIFGWKNLTNAKIKIMCKTDSLSPSMISKMFYISLPTPVYIR